MRLSISTKQSNLEIDLSKGNQFYSLNFYSEKKSKFINVILPYNPNENFFYSGNFLMFPWVNRAKEIPKIFFPKARDEKGLPIHGLCYDSERKIIYQENSRLQTTLKNKLEDLPEIKETFTISPKDLSVETEFFNSSNKIQFFSYGYHPYLKLEESIDNYNIFSNMDKIIPLGKDLLPKEPISLLESEFKNEMSLDNLFLDHSLYSSEKKIYFGLRDLISEEKVWIETNRTPGQIPLSYFQIYTPPDRKSIAIEPLSSIGNSFQLGNHYLVNLNPGEKKIGRFQICFRDS